ncbi:MAG: hypothetical protein HRT68_02075 [Flavobacteriaceae bacterium]|nr:hypothetical protein [Flavobacteriaceae bacterium]
MSFVNTIISKKHWLSFSESDTFIDITVSPQEEEEISIEIHFKEPIISWRNYNYEWVNTNQRLIANYYSPKIFVLKNQYKVLSNKNIGCWEFDPKHPNKLTWIIESKYLNPILKYNGTGGKKFEKTHSNNNDLIELKLLFSQDDVPEFSRSKIPFSAILCLTDHCDFDTFENTQEQLKAFEHSDIKITKGFFLNHFSKRDENISWEREAELIQKWEDQGHEICYHSLSQSIKNLEEAKTDFYSFQPPSKQIHTWIDHGFQPYNFTLFKFHEYETQKWVDNLNRKDIKNLWTYIDSGTGGKGIINQLNPNQFTLEKTKQSLRNLKFTQKVSVLIRSYFLFYRVDTPDLFSKYKRLALDFKGIVFKRKLKFIFPFINSAWKVFTSLFIDLIKWSVIKNKHYPFAKYAPVIFRNKIGNQSFQMFQTVEINNLKDTFCPSNIDSLIQESGLCIAHTYLSLPNTYHYGKFLDQNKINPVVQKNLVYIDQKIKDEKLWNPTINQLISHFKLIEELEFSFDKNNKIVSNNKTPVRYIDYEDSSH